MQAINAAEQQHVPFVGESSTAQSFTRNDQRKRPPVKACQNSPKEDRTPSQWFFRVGPYEVEAAEVFRRFLLDQRKRGITVDKVAILYENADIYGESAFAATRTIAHALHVKVKYVPYHTVLGRPEAPLGSPCSDEEKKLDDRLLSGIRAIKGFGADVVFAASHSADAVATVQTITKLKYAPRALLAYGGGYESPDFIKRTTAGRLECHLPAGNPYGVITRRSWSPDIKNVTETMTTVRKAFKDHYGEEMTDNSARGLTAMLALAKAIDDAGPRNRGDISRYRADIVAALSRLNLTADHTIMPWGIKFNRYGQNRRARVLLEQKRSSGDVVVYPTALGTDDAIWPLSWTPSP